MQLILVSQSSHIYLEKLKLDVQTRLLTDHNTELCRLIYIVAALHDFNEAKEFVTVLKIIEEPLLARIVTETYH